MEVFPDNGDITKEIAKHGKYADPKGSANDVVRNKFFVIHRSHASNKRRKCTDNRHKSRKYNGFSSVFFVKLFGFVDMLLINKRYFGIIDNFAAKKMANPIVNGIPQYRSDNENSDDTPDVERPQGRNRACGKQEGISRSSLYYQPIKSKKDWLLKNQIERVLSEHHSYGYRRVALELKINKKRTRRIMRLFSIKPYRRRGRKFRKSKDLGTVYPNLIQQLPFPDCHNIIWVSDFTYIPFKGKFLYLCGQR